jgi:cell division transport system permease protein
MQTESKTPSVKNTSKAWLIKGILWALSMMCVDFLLIPYINNTAFLTTGYVFVAAPLWLLLGIVLAFISRLFTKKR